MQRSTMEVEKETGANANKRGPPDGPNAAENEWPVIPVTAAAAASLTTGQLDSTACGVQLWMFHKFMNAISTTISTRL